MVRTPNKMKMAIICTTITYNDKKVNFYFKFILFTLNEALQTFIQVVRVSAYISTTISAAADEGPDETTRFPAGLHCLLTFPTRMSKISQKSMCLNANFSEKGHICELFRERTYM